MIEILPKKSIFDLNLRELWDYRDLVRMFVRREFTATYKQTILGPLWFIINPLLTTLVFTVIFGNIARLPTEGVPPFLFYMAGNAIWSYFASCLTRTSSTFTSNAHLMGKVYFPRLAVPLSTVIYGLFSFAIQLFMLLGFTVFYCLRGQVPAPGLSLLLLPLLVLETMALGLGFGIIVSSLTTRYRDLSVLVNFGVSLWMYATPVVYASSAMPERWRRVILFNPVSPIVETFRSIVIGGGRDIPAGYLLVSLAVTAVVLGLGVILFSHVERTFMDTV